MENRTKTVMTHPYQKIIAHRGAGKDAPENTLAAFRYGYEQGYRMYECDVKLSKDKALFLLHDSTLERTTNGKGLAKAKSWKSLSKLDAGKWHSPLYVGETMPRFEAIVDFVLENHCRLDVEIKPNDDEAYETGQAVATYLYDKLQATLRLLVAEEGQGQEDITAFDMARFIEALYQADSAKEMIFNASNDLKMPAITSIESYPFLLSSFEPEALRGAYETQPILPRALLVDDWDLGQEAIWQQLEDLECSGIITNYKIITPDFIERCHQAGRFVMVYTANDLNDIERLYEMGVDSVITDNMSLAELS